MVVTGGQRAERSDAVTCGLPHTPRLPYRRPAAAAAAAMKPCSATKTSSCSQRNGSSSSRNTRIDAAGAARPGISRRVLGTAARLCALLTVWVLNREVISPGCLGSHSPHQLSTPGGRSSWKGRFDRRNHGDVFFPAVTLPPPMRVVVPLDDVTPYTGFNRYWASAAQEARTTACSICARSGAPSPTTYVATHVPDNSEVRRTWYGSGLLEFQEDLRIGGSLISLDVRPGPRDLGSVHGPVNIEDLEHISVRKSDPSSIQLTSYRVHR